MSKSTPIADKSIIALMFALVMLVLYAISQEYLRAANLLLVNPFVKEVIYIVGYYEFAIIAIPLIGGFICGAVAMWFYSHEE